MLKNVKIRILAFFMALTLSFCVCANEYNEVKALEWVAPVVGLDTALKALLGLLGITASVGLASQIDWHDLQDDCVQYQIQKGNDAVAVGRWWDKVISGGLDTASSCWVSFKEWAQSIIDNTGSSSPSGLELLDACNSYFGISPAFNFTNVNINSVKGVLVIQDKTQPTHYYWYLFYENTFLRGDRALYFTPSADNYNSVSGAVRGNSAYDTPNLTFTIYDDIPYIGNMAYFNDGVYLGEVTNLIRGDYTNLFHEYDGQVVSPSDNELDGALSDLGAIGLSPDVATDLPYDGVIDIPWENVGATDTAIDDAFDDAIDKVNTGTWTLDQYWSWVQNITNVFAYDTTNNYLLPNDGDDEKADDKIQQNLQRGAMVLYGLEKVFPFCIPWDIYAFVNLLVADPVAPVIEYPLYNPVSGEDEIITIDFSVWESQVILMRYIQDFLLIIGLLLLARSLIGAGGSD